MEAKMYKMVAELFSRDKVWALSRGAGRRQPDGDYQSGRSCSVSSLDCSLSTALLSHHLTTPVMAPHLMACTAARQPHSSPGSARHPGILLSCSLPPYLLLGGMAPFLLVHIALTVLTLGVVRNYGWSADHITAAYRGAVGLSRERGLVPRCHAWVHCWHIRAGWR